MNVFQEIDLKKVFCWLIAFFLLVFKDYVDGKHITEIGAVGGCDVDMVEDMVTIMKRQNLLVDGDCLRLGTDIGKGKSNLFNFFLIKRQRATPNIYFFYISKFISMIENLIVYKIDKIYVFHPWLSNLQNTLRSILFRTIHRSI